MKFVLENAKMVLADSGYIGGKPNPGSLMDKINHFSDWAVGKEHDFIVQPMLSWFHDAGVSLWHWFILNLPDIMGYGAVAAGICIILGAMFGKGGMMKPLAIYAGLLILALCILGGA